MTQTNTTSGFHLTLTNRKYSGSHICEKDTITNTRISPLSTIKKGKKTSSLATKLFPKTRTYFSVAPTGYCYSNHHGHVQIGRSRTCVSANGDSGAAHGGRIRNQKKKRKDHPYYCRGTSVGSKRRRTPPGAPILYRDARCTRQLAKDTL